MKRQWCGTCTHLHTLVPAEPSLPHRQIVTSCGCNYTLFKTFFGTSSNKERGLLRSAHSRKEAGVWGSVARAGAHLPTVPLKRFVRVREQTSTYRITENQSVTSAYTGYGAPQAQAIILRDCLATAPRDTEHHHPHHWISKVGEAAEKLENIWAKS